jgi:hypothetical protein
MGPIRCRETSVNKVQKAPHNVPEERRPQLYRHVSLQSRKVQAMFPHTTDRLHTVFR